MKQQIKFMMMKKIVVLIGILISIISCGDSNANKQQEETSENNVFYSKEIGWTISIPTNWKIISTEQNEENVKKGSEALQKMVEGEIDSSKLKSLISFQKDQFNNFQSTSETFEPEYPEEWEVSSAASKELVYNSYENQGIKVDSTATTIINIDGLDFHTYEFIVYDSDGAIILNQIMYSRLINGLDFGVNINYNNESDKKELVDAWMNSKFIK
jgi:hypothetical protein